MTERDQYNDHSHLMQTPDEDQNFKLVDDLNNALREQYPEAATELTRFFLDILARDLEELRKVPSLFRKQEGERSVAGSFAHILDFLNFLKTDFADLESPFTPGLSGMNAMYLIGKAGEQKGFFNWSLHEDKPDTISIFNLQFGESQYALPIDIEIDLNDQILKFVVHEKMTDEATLSMIAALYQKMGLPDSYSEERVREIFIERNKSRQTAIMFNLLSDPLVLESWFSEGDWHPASLRYPTPEEQAQFFQLTKAVSLRADQKLETVVGLGSSQLLLTAKFDLSGGYPYIEARRPSSEMSTYVYLPGTVTDDNGNTQNTIMEIAFINDAPYAIFEKSWAYLLRSAEAAGLI